MLAIHFTARTVGSLRAIPWPALPGVVRRTAGVVSGRRGVHGLPGLAVLAFRSGLPRVRSHGVGGRRIRQGLAVRCVHEAVSRTAGTIFQDTRTPLTVWFAP